MKRSTYLIAVAIAFSSFTGSQSALADSVCGPGKQLATNAWACVSGNGGSITRNSGQVTGGQIAAGLAVGGAILSIVQSLASQTQATDNVGRADLDEQRHGTNSRQLNRQAIALQQAGKFDSARIAFLKAAGEAVIAGNQREAKINQKNAEIADALHWLRSGYDAEKAGKPTRANIAYRMGIDAATRAGNESLVSKLRTANDALIKNNSGSSMIPSQKNNCMLLNGKYACY